MENVCLRSSFIAQMFLYGDGLRSCCVAIVVPDEEVLMKWASDNGRKDDTFENLCLDEVQYNIHVLNYCCIGNKANDI